MLTNKKQQTPPPTHIDKQQPAVDAVKLLNEKQAAEILDVKPGTLSVWRATNRYPALKYIKVGANVRYAPADLQEFLRGRTVGAAR